MSKRRLYEIEASDDDSLPELKPTSLEGPMYGIPLGTKRKRSSVSDDGVLDSGSGPFQQKSHPSVVVRRSQSAASSSAGRNRSHNVEGATLESGSLSHPTSRPHGPISSSVQNHHVTSGKGLSTNGDVTTQAMSSAEGGHGFGKASGAGDGDGHIGRGEVQQAKATQYLKDIFRTKRQGDIAFDQELTHYVCDAVCKNVPQALVEAYRTIPQSTVPGESHSHCAQLRLGFDGGSRRLKSTKKELGVENSAKLLMLYAEVNFLRKHIDEEGIAAWRTIRIRSVPIMSFKTPKSKEMWQKHWMSVSERDAAIVAQFLCEAVILLMERPESNGVRVPEVIVTELGTDTGEESSAMSVFCVLDKFCEQQDEERRKRSLDSKTEKEVAKSADHLNNNPNARRGYVDTVFLWWSRCEMHQQSLVGEHCVQRLLLALDTGEGKSNERFKSFSKTLYLDAEVINVQNKTIRQDYEQYLEKSVTELGKENAALAESLAFSLGFNESFEEAAITRRFGFYRLQNGRFRCRISEKTVLTQSLTKLVIHKRQPSRLNRWLTYGGGARHATVRVMETCMAVIQSLGLSVMRIGMGWRKTGGGKGWKTT